MPAQSVGGLRPLPRRKVPRPEQHALRLPLRALRRHEPHRRPRRRLADGLRVRRVVLPPLHERLHISRRHQANLEPHRPQLPARCRAPPQASIATMHGPRFDISSRNRSRDAFLRNAADPSSRVPRSWKLLLPGPTPIMPVLSIVDAPFSHGTLRSAIMAPSGAAGRGVHSIAFQFLWRARRLFR